MFFIIYLFCFLRFVCVCDSLSLFFSNERMIFLLYSFDYCDSVYVLYVYKLQKENEKVDEE